MQWDPYYTKKTSKKVCVQTQISIILGKIHVRSRHFSGEPWEGYCWKISTCKTSVWSSDLILSCPTWIFGVCQEMLMDSHGPQLLKSGFDWKAQTKENRRVLSIRETFIYLHLFVVLQYSISLAYLFMVDVVKEQHISLNSLNSFICLSAAILQEWLPRTNCNDTKSL